VQAEKILLDDLNSGKINKEYLPVVGLQSFLDVTSQVKRFLSVTHCWAISLHL
jgi:hypothetical protein